MGKATDKMTETREVLKSIIKDCINIICETYGEDEKSADISGFQAEIVVDNMCFDAEETITEVQTFDYIELLNDGRLVLTGRANDVECDGLNTDDLARIADTLELDLEMRKLYSA